MGEGFSGIGGFGGFGFVELFAHCCGERMNIEPNGKIRAICIKKVTQFIEEFCEGVDCCGVGHVSLQKGGERQGERKLPPPEKNYLIRAS